MSGLTYFCRECCRFVGGPMAPCRSCGHAHTRDRMALEYPVPFRTRRHRRPKRDGWEFLLGRR